MWRNLYENITTTTVRLQREQGSQLVVWSMSHSSKQVSVKLLSMLQKYRTRALSPVLEVLRRIPKGGNDNDKIRNQACEDPGCGKKVLKRKRLPGKGDKRVQRVRTWCGGTLWSQEWLEWKVQQKRCKVRQRTEGLNLDPKEEGYARSRGLILIILTGTVSSRESRD